MTAKTPINAKLIVTRIDACADDIFGRWAARKHGGLLLPGIETAKTRFVLNGPYLSQDRYDEMGLVCLGCGESRFDKKRKDERLPETSCARLVMNYLGVTDRPTRLIGEEIHDRDISDKAPITQLSGLVKSFHRHSPADTGSVFEWVDIAFDAIHHQLGLPFAGDQAELGVLSYFEGLLKAGWYKGKDREITYVLKLLTGSAENVNEKDPDRTYYTEIDHIVRAMQRSGATHDQVYKWAQKAITFLIADQELFIPAINLIREKRNQFMVKATGVNNGRLRVCVLQTDNPMARPAANHCGQHVTVIRNTSGQIKIFLDQKTGLNLDCVMGMIRWLETPIDQRSKLNWHGLCTTPGKMECAPHWYYDRKMGKILNGSATHPDVTPSKLATKAIIEIIGHGFTSGLIGKWMRDHYVVKAPRPAVQKPPFVPVVIQASEPAPTSNNNQDGSGQTTVQASASSDPITPAVAIA